MRKRKLRYIKPKIIVKKIKLNIFSFQYDYFDPMGFGNGESPKLMAQFFGDDPFASWSCFLAGTNILMADRSLKEIQNIKVGDEIASYDINNKKIIKSKVIRVLIHNNTSRYLFINERIKVTKMHRFWTNGIMWKRAYNLKIDDWLLNSRGEKIVIKKINKIIGHHTVYNFHIDAETHNYFAEDILVHNWK